MAAFILLTAALVFTLGNWGEMIIWATEPFHRICLFKAQNLGWAKPIVSALICGKPLSHTQPLLHSSLVHLGIIHLFVISGAHLHFFEKFLLKTRVSKRYLNILLFCYVALSGSNLPILRAFLCRCFRLAQFPTRHPLRTLLPGGLILILFPKEWGGLSLALSWVAHMGLISIPGKNLLIQSLWIYLLLAPLLVFLQLASPLSIFLQVLAAPFVGLFLLPFSLFHWAFPSIFGESIFLYFTNILIFTSRQFPAPIVWEQHMPNSFPIIYCLSLQALLWIHFFLNSRKGPL